MTKLCFYIIRIREETIFQNIFRTFIKKAFQIHCRSVMTKLQIQKKLFNIYFTLKNQYSQWGKVKSHLEKKNKKKRDS